MWAAWEAIAAGAGLGLRYNPVAAAAAAAVAAAYLTHGEPRRSRVALAAAVVCGAWLLGDGLRVLARARDLWDGASPLLGEGVCSWASWAAIGTWALVGCGAGYALPAWAGVYAGRRTVLGVDWLVGASFAVTLALALSALAGVLSHP